MVHRDTAHLFHIHLPRSSLKVSDDELSEHTDMGQASLCWVISSSIMRQFTVHGINCQQTTKDSDGRRPFKEFYPGSSFL